MNWIDEMHAVSDAVDVDALKAESEAYRKAHPKTPVEPMSTFRAERDKVKTLATQALKRHRAARTQQ